MKKLFLINSLLVVLSFFCSTAQGQTTGETIVTGICEGSGGGGKELSSLVFFDKELNELRKINLAFYCVGEIKFIKKDNKLLIAGSTRPGLIVFDLVSQRNKVILEDKLIYMMDFDGVGNIYALASSEEIFVLDSESLAVKKVIKTDTNTDGSNTFHRVSMAVLKKSGRVCISNTTARDSKIFTIRIIDSNGKEKKIGTVKTKESGFEFADIAVSSDENNVYIASENELIQFNLKSSKKQKLLTQVKFPQDIYFDEESKVIYILSLEGFINIINLKTKEQSKLILVGRRIENGFLKGNGQFLLANTSDSFSENTVFVVDMKTQMLVKSTVYIGFGIRAGGIEFISE